jgi:hypothetical protein
MSFSPFNWLRDALGIKHDIIAAEKTQLEIEKLRDEKSRALHLIQVATLEEILQYDTKTLKTVLKAEEELRETLSMCDPVAYGYACRRVKAIRQELDRRYKNGDTDAQIPPDKHF